MSTALTTASIQTPARTSTAASGVASASTVSEVNGTDKTGSVGVEGLNATIESLDRVRVDASGRGLTTNFGAFIADNQNSLKFGTRGPVLLEDFILREKVTHFDHERIPERIVHARGSGAHGYFECTAPLTRHTQAAPFQQVGKITPVFVRFSTVAGERGSKDTARDVRGFAVKFYTDQGNWDLVGNNMPVFFIQDAMKFPDLVHAVKPEPHHAHAAGGERARHLLGLRVADAGVDPHADVGDVRSRDPAQFPHHAGFAVHTFRLVNDAGDSVFCKFHWQPHAGTHSLVWDEAVKISGADPDFHRRDLWEAIEAGAYPQWDLQVQVFTEEDADRFSFDILDATKIVPEELVPLQTVGRLVLNRNPDNFFAETEQVAFCTANVVPGIDFSNDPLLAGRIHSYHDTQLSRLGGPNFHEIPINAPVVQVHNNQRDGIHRQAIHRGAVAYEPNSLAGGCPFQAGAAHGFVTVPARLRARDEAAKVRAKPELFADHYTQARLFFESQSAPEQAAHRRCVRVRVEQGHGAGGAGAHGGFAAQRVGRASAQGGRQDRLRADAAPTAARDGAAAQARGHALAGAVAAVPPRQRLGRGPQGGAVRRTEGRLERLLLGLARPLGRARARCCVAWRRASGRCAPPTARTVDADASFDNEPGFLFDALVLPDGCESAADDARALESVRDVYRHCKPIFAFGSGADMLARAGIPGDASDSGLIVATSEPTGQIDRFIEALGAPRDFSRETDPPRV